MTIQILLVAGGLALLYFGAEGLVRCSSALALRLGVPPLLVGLTVVAFGTSSPELVVSLDAAMKGRGDIAIGNVIGSNICNIALILGLSALVRPLRVEARLVRLDVPLVIAASLLLGLLLLDGRLSRWEGLILLLGLITYVIHSIHQSRKEGDKDQGTFTDARPPKENLALNLLLLALSLGLLASGANLLLKGSITLAESLGLSEAAIGLTLVAVGTSLPELATSAVAAAKNNGDISIGNIVGSNLFNILGILGLAALVWPVTGKGIAPVDLAVMAGASLLLLPFMRTGFVLTRWEGAALLAAYAAYTYNLYMSRGG